MTAHYTQSSGNSGTGKQPSAKCGKWALWLLILTVVIPIHILLILEGFRVGSLGLFLTVLYFLIFAGLPCSFVSLVLGITGIVRKERSLKPAVISVALSIGPVLLGLWVLFNFITMGEPW